MVIVAGPRKLVKSRDQTIQVINNLHYAVEHYFGTNSSWSGTPLQLIGFYVAPRVLCDHCYLEQIDGCNRKSPLPIQECVILVQEKLCLSLTKFVSALGKADRNRTASLVIRQHPDGATVENLTICLDSICKR